jgi:drug/metabolite transporter (DMT)-like permease
MPVNPSRNETMTPWTVLGLVLLCIIFGANAVAIKISFTGIGTFTSAGLRFALASAAITIWARLSGRRFRVPKADIKPLLIICAGFTIQISIFYLGLSRTLASRGSLVVNAVPFLVLIFAHFFLPDDAITVRKFIGMVVGFSGVALVLSDTGALGGGLRTGDLIVFAAAATWAANAVYTKTVIHRFDPFQVVLYPMLCAVPVYFLEGWLWDDIMIGHIGGAIIAAMLYQSLLSAAIGFVVWNTCLQRFGASALHSFIFIVPVTGVIAGGLILAEPITSRLIVSAALVAAGIGLVNIKARGTAPFFPIRRWF